MRPPIEHRYLLDGDAYCLREATFEGQRRIAQTYAMSLAQGAVAMGPSAPPAPLASPEALWGTYARILENVDGTNLYAKAVTQECLVEAPLLWWHRVPALPDQNGMSQQRITFQEVSGALWDAHLKEVNVFLDLIFRAHAAPAEPAASGCPAEPVLVATPEALSPVLRGRAE
jgi:hypothetical protein